MHRNDYEKAWKFFNTLNDEQMRMVVQAIRIYQVDRPTIINMMDEILKYRNKGE